MIIYFLVSRKMVHLEKKPKTAGLAWQEANSGSYCFAPPLLLPTLHTRPPPPPGLEITPCYQQGKILITSNPGAPHTSRVSSLGIGISKFKIQVDWRIVSVSGQTDRIFGHNRSPVPPRKGARDRRQMLKGPRLWPPSACPFSKRSKSTCSLVLKKTHYTSSEMTLSQAVACVVCI